MSLKSFKKPLFIFGLLIVGLTLGISGKFVLAGLSHSASGWAWSGSESSPDGVINGNESGMGWISMNSSDCDTDNNGIIDVAACGTIGTPIPNYGVNIPNSDGPLSGYAWSEHFGWISFNSNGSDLVGCSPVLAGATRVGSSINGGARILSIRDAGSYPGGWDGCISLSGTGYGVTKAGPNLSGYAWSSDLGWIDFSGVTISDISPTVTLTTNNCTIPAGSNSCNIAVSWTSANTVGPVSVRQDGTQFATNPSLPGGTSRTVEHGPNIFEFYDNGSVILPDGRKTATASCENTSTWNGTFCAANPLPPTPPTITITADPKIVRTNQTAPINISITANYAMNCTLYGVNLTPILFEHNANIDPQSYNFTTRSLKSTTVAQVTCTDGATITETREARVEVLGTIQEV